MMGVRGTRTVAARQHSSVRAKAAADHCEPVAGRMLVEQRTDAGRGGPQPLSAWRELPRSRDVVCQYPDRVNPGARQRIAEVIGMAGQ